MKPMHMEIITDPLGGIDLRSDLNVNLTRIQALGLSEISLFFGFSWGNHIYEEDWREIPASPARALELVKKAEKKGFGELGDDNLYLFVREYNLRLLYSHESDIHLSFAAPNRLVHDILGRWRDQQWLCYNQSKVLAKLNSKGRMI